MAGKNDVAETIRQGIVDGELKPGQSIGSIDATAQKYEASVGATRLAFQELVQQGYLVARGRAGHFVADTIPDDPVAALPRRLSTDRLESIEEKLDDALPLLQDIIKRLDRLERRQK